MINFLFFLLFIIQYCQFTPSAERCKKALSHDNPDLYAKIYEPEAAAAAAAAALVTEVNDKLKLTGEVEKTDAASLEDSEDTEKKHQSRGGKGLLRDESVKLDKEALKLAV